MKYTVVVVFLFLGNPYFAQRKFELGFGLSNQGQFDKLVENFYFPAGPTVWLDDSNKGKDLRLKANLYLSYLFNYDFEFRLRTSYAIRKNEYEKILPTSSLKTNDLQNIFEFSPSFGVRKSWGRFSFSTGVELPVYLVGDLNEQIIYEEFSDSVNLSAASKSDIRMDGGFIIGLNQYISVRTVLKNQLFVFSELNYGLLYAKLGEKYVDFSQTTFPTISDSYFEFNKSYSKIYFSSIQVQIGIGYKFK